MKHQKALVCGTTGFSPEEMQQFQDAATLIPMLYTANTSKLVKYNEQASGRMCLGTFSRRARSLATFFIFVRVRISGTQFLICSTFFDYNCSDACASIFLFVLILVHLFLLIDLFLSHFTNLLFFSSEGRYLRSMTPRTPLQLHFH